MEEKITVTVGIPAYNEEKNIGKLLPSLLDQGQANFLLEKILVVSDGSTDETARIVRSMDDHRIRLISNKNRIGPALSQNVIVKESTSDVLVLVDADILPEDNSFLQSIIQPFEENGDLGIVGGYPVPLPPRTFFEGVINYSVRFKNRVYKEINGGNNVYLCHGRARAFSRKFYKNLKWKATLGEDAFSYLACKKEGFDFRFEPDAKVFYRSPRNLTEHLKQSVRFLKSKRSLKKHFDSRFVDKEYPDYKALFLRKVPRFFIKNPVYFGIYTLIYLVSNLYLFVNPVVRLNWSASWTTKEL